MMPSIPCAAIHFRFDPYKHKEERGNDTRVLYLASK
jgi:hypothetical protein